MFPVRFFGRASDKEASPRRQSLEQPGPNAARRDREPREDCRAISGGAHTYKKACRADLLSVRKILFRSEGIRQSQGLSAQRAPALPVAVACLDVPYRDGFASDLPGRTARLCEKGPKGQETQSRSGPDALGHRQALDISLLCETYLPVAEPDSARSPVAALWLGAARPKRLRPAR